VFGSCFPNGPVYEYAHARVLRLGEGLCVGPDAVVSRGSHVFTSAHEAPSVAASQVIRSAVTSWPA
jgi:hypothetical protein